MNAQHFFYHAERKTWRTCCIFKVCLIDVGFCDDFPLMENSVRCEDSQPTDLSRGAQRWQENSWKHIKEVVSEMKWIIKMFVLEGRRNRVSRLARDEICRKVWNERRVCIFSLHPDETGGVISKTRTLNQGGGNNQRYAGLISTQTALPLPTTIRSASAGWWAAADA